VCQDVTYLLDEVVGVDVIIIDVSKSFELVPHYRLLTKLAAKGADLRVVFWVREFLVVHTQRVRVGEELSKKVKVILCLPQGRILGPQLFLVYVNDFVGTST